MGFGISCEGGDTVAELHILIDGDDKFRLSVFDFAKVDETVRPFNYHVNLCFWGGGTSP